MKGPMPRWVLWGLLGALVAFLVGFAFEGRASGSLATWLADGFRLNRSHYFDDGYFSALLWPLIGFAIGSLVACESVPEPRLTYQDHATVVQLRNDPQAGSGHSHPTKVTAGRMTQVLRNIHVQKRGDPVLGIITGKSEELPAFSAAEIQTLASALSTTAKRLVCY